MNETTFHHCVYSLKEMMRFNSSLYKLNCIYSLLEMWGWQRRLHVRFWLAKLWLLSLWLQFYERRQSPPNTTGLTAHSSRWNLHVPARPALRWTSQAARRPGQEEQRRLRRSRGRSWPTSCHEGDHLTCCVSLSVVVRKLGARWGHKSDTASTKKGWWTSPDFSALLCRGERVSLWSLLEGFACAN